MAQSSKRAVDSSGSSSCRILILVLRNPLVCVGGEQVPLRSVHHIPEDLLKPCNSCVSPMPTHGDDSVLDRMDQGWHVVCFGGIWIITACETVEDGADG